MGTQLMEIVIPLWSPLRTQIKVLKVGGDRKGGD